MGQKKSAPISPAYFFDEGSTVEWTPNAEKLTTSAPGVKIASYDDEWFGAPVSVIEMDGKIDDIEEAVYIESHLCNAAPSTTASCPSSSPRTRRLRAATTAPASSRPSAPSRSARPTRRSRRIRVLHPCESVVGTCV